MNITRNELINRYNNFLNSPTSIIYCEQDKDINRMYLDPQEVFCTIGSKIITIEDIYDRLPSNSQVWCILRNDKRLVTRRKKVKEHKVTKQNILTTPLLGDIVLNSPGDIKKTVTAKYTFVPYNKPFNKNLVDCDCLTYKCGEDSSKVLPINSVTVIYKNCFIVHNFSIYGLFPELDTHKLIKGTKELPDLSTMESKLRALQDIEFDSLKNVSLVKLKCLIDRFKELSEKTKLCDKLLKQGKILESEELNKELKGTIGNIMKDLGILKKHYVQIIMTWYYLSNKKYKYITDKGCTNGIYIVKPKLFKYIPTLRTNGDLLKNHIILNELYKDCL